VTHLTAPATEPRRSRGGAGSAGRGQWVRYPWRVVEDADTYAPADTNVYGKIAALSKGRPSTAGVERIAAYLGTSVSTVERGLRRLSRPAPSDGVREVYTHRRSHVGTGTGRTAERWCRTPDRGEAYVWGPVLAADTLRPVLHRLYLALRYQVHIRRHQPTLAELAGLLRHHGGVSKGQALAEAAVSRLLDELADLGWISLEKGAGYRGRHLITVHDDPVRPVTEPPVTPDPDDGSGPDLDDGSLAYKEDQGLNDARNTPVGGAFRRRRDDREWVATPVDNPAAVTAVMPGTPEALYARPTARPYTGPPLTLSGRVWAVLDPVRDLLPGIETFQVRRIAREIGRQLDSGIGPEDIRDQLQLLRGWTDSIHDPGAWILDAALPDRPGPCRTTDCYRGYQRHTGARCKACDETATA
jgi:hypothetical protein